MTKIKYYKYQSPSRTILWTYILAWLTPFPWSQTSLFESIIRTFIDSHFHPNYSFIIGSSLGFTALFIIASSLKKKIPRSITVFGNALMLIMFAFCMKMVAISVGMMLVIDSPDLNHYAHVIIYGFLFIMSFRITSRLKKSFEDCDPENDREVVALWILILIIHAIGIGFTIPAFFVEPPVLEGFSGFGFLIGYTIFIFPIIYIVRLAVGMLKSFREFQRAARKSWGFKEALIILIFFASWVPVLGHLVNGGVSTRNHSVYNTTWSGASTFKETVESMGYDTASVQSSLSVISRLDRSVCLVIMGPVQTYNPLAEIPFFVDMINDPYFSMLILDDHGSTTTLMMNLMIASSASSIAGSPSMIPMALFPKGILWDNTSYDTNPTFPVIEQWDTTSPITNGVNEVVLSKASALVGGELLSAFGWNPIGKTADQYSFIDMNNDGIYRYEDDHYWIPSLVTDFIAKIGLNYSEGLPLGGYQQVVFAATENSNGNRFFVGADASMFNNELIRKYDNQRFAQNLITWLTRGNRSIEVVFDESHNLPYGTREFSSAAMFGMFQGYVNWLSTNPFLAWFYPLYALRTLNRWLPKPDSKKEVKKREEKESEEKLEQLEFRTSSFFASKINWYRKNRKFNQAILLLHRRIDRKINALMGGKPATISSIIEKIKIERGRYINKNDLSRIESYLKKIDDIRKKRLNVEDVELFNEIFFEMSWLSDNL